MKSYIGQIENLTLANSNFRQVIFTGKHQQLVLMSLKPGTEIGLEVHNDVDQFFRFEAGVGKVILDAVTYTVKDGSAVIVTAGTKHNIVNISKTEDLKLYTIYSPPNHPDGTLHKTKAEADKYELHHH
ncbi:cupin [Candidatus Gottesmanbacteria bacterium RBG_16_43_7]|uniref:Cupin n=1 Tax=Candidatus Gottesmanbacteria bacterium RBG_16_43_7 TaxID=1798373 RepID=A0A1F5ZAQ7_9BACT|nr:MAG: cupin [Candidatus Gottesmanbacteria bacterium RBG_16_43_7]